MREKPSPPGRRFCGSVGLLPKPSLGGRWHGEAVTDEGQSLLPWEKGDRLRWMWGIFQRVPQQNQRGKGGAPTPALDKLGHPLPKERASLWKHTQVCHSERSEESQEQGQRGCEAADCGDSIEILRGPAPQDDKLRRKTRTVGDDGPYDV